MRMLFLCFRTLRSWLLVVWRQWNLGQPQRLCPRRRLTLGIFVGGLDDRRLREGGERFFARE